MICKSFLYLTFVKRTNVTAKFQLSSLLILNWTLLVALVGDSTSLPPRSSFIYSSLYNRLLAFPLYYHRVSIELVATTSLLDFCLLVVPTPTSSNISHVTLCLLIPYKVGTQPFCSCVFIPLAIELKHGAECTEPHSDIRYKWPFWIDLWSCVPTLLSNKLSFSMWGERKVSVYWLFVRPALESGDATVPSKGLSTFIMHFMVKVWKLTAYMQVSINIPVTIFWYYDFLVDKWGKI